MNDAAEYSVSVRRRMTEDGMMFVGTVAEFPDVAVYAEDASSAYDEVLEAIDGLRALFADQRRPFPRPIEREQEYSGRFIVRVPKSLHRALAETADVEGVSLNQYIVSILAGHIGKLSAIGSAPAEGDNVQVFDARGNTTSARSIVHLKAVK